MTEKMVSFETSDLKKIGLWFTGFGILFTLIGVALFFDKGFLAIGNILFLPGVILITGPKSALDFFMKPKNFKGSLSLAAGFIFVIAGWPVVGMIFETFGSVFLSSGIWPALARKFQILGWLLHDRGSPYYRRKCARRCPV